MAQLENLRAVLDELGAKVIERAKSNLKIQRTVRGKKARRYASGALYNGLTFNYIKRGNKIVQWFGVPNGPLEAYADVIEEGRRAGQLPPPIAPIIEWIKRKKITPRNYSSKNKMRKSQFIKKTDKSIERAAKYIAKSIGAKGIEGIHYTREAFDDTVPEFMDALGDAWRKDVEFDVRLKSQEYLDKAGLKWQSL
jgi:hypothetical protein